MSAVLPAFDLRAWSQAALSQVESAMALWLAEGAVPQLESLNAPIRYSVLDGGKRLRPLLALAARAAVAAHDGKAAPADFDTAALRAGCAVELIHAYSLVHDDMPCMDNDVLRRGKPTVHVKFGEAGALLAGDALQALAFEWLTPADDSIPAATQAVLCARLARAAGRNGMAGGQAIDLASVGVALDESALRHMHSLKTGALLQASVAMGAACGAAPARALAALESFGAALGLAFQVVDDILDVTADSATLGKTAGKDAAADKPTYVSLLGLDGARARARQLHAAAISALADSGLGDTAALAALAGLVMNRDH
ncbi:polyprenyl synthetase family protein [Xylophilus rhododendri]|uniref:Polyprenyl synthetase family protein n=1 Tax=Xylophilus rhododendri TaxID=2697032 RepID=A0A857JA69_9BURK|nr:farnesyl diphosphate synthase [Xylophilus rhododendri]QHJ00807.1 polyprenyl synthetase family protein [Xylophilus rhododendri]